MHREPPQIEGQGLEHLYAPSRVCRVVDDVGLIGRSMGAATAILSTTIIPGALCCETSH